MEKEKAQGCSLPVMDPLDWFYLAFILEGAALGSQTSQGSTHLLVRQEIGPVLELGWCIWCLDAQHFQEDCAYQGPGSCCCCCVKPQKLLWEDWSLVYEQPSPASTPLLKVKPDRVLPFAASPETKPVHEPSPHSPDANWCHRAVFQQAFGTFCSIVDLKLGQGAQKKCSFTCLL